MASYFVGNTNCRLIPFCHQSVNIWTVGSPSFPHPLPLFTLLHWFRFPFLSCVHKFPKFLICWTWLNMALLQLSHQGTIQESYFFWQSLHLGHVTAVVNSQQDLKPPAYLLWDSPDIDVLFCYIAFIGTCLGEWFPGCWNQQKTSQDLQSQWDPEGSVLSPRTHCYHGSRRTTNDCRLPSGHRSVTIQHLGQK